MSKLENVKTLDMVNGEITKVEYGGEVYVKVDEGQGMENIGDIVIGKKGKGRDDSYFEIVEICSLNGSRSGKFYDEDDDLDGMVYYEVFRKQSAPTLNERVSVLESKVAELGGENPVAKEEAPEVGDYAKVICERHGHKFSKGDIVELVGDGYNPEFMALRVTDNKGWFVSIEEIIRATDEEVAEAKAEAKWASIGRKPNEFKKGDIVRLDCCTDVYFGEVREDCEGSQVKFCHLHDKKYGNTTENVKNITLITPVESRFDHA